MNKKPVIAFVAILALLVALAYIATRPSQSTSATTHIVTTPSGKTNNGSSNAITPNTISQTSNTSPSGSGGAGTIPSQYQNCISPKESVPLPNGNFSTGTYEYWNVTGQGFLNDTGQAAPTNIIAANEKSIYYGQPWSNYSGNFMATTYHGGLSLSTGNLTSAPFEVIEPYLNFKIVSPKNALLYVELLHNGKPFRISHYNTLNSSSGNREQSVFVNATMPIINFVCQNISVRVVAGVVGSVTNRYDFMAVGDFVQSKYNLETPGTLVNSTVLPP